MPAFSLPPATLRPQFEAQLEFMTRLSRHAFDTIGQLSELNIRTARQALDDGIRFGRALAACKDPLQLPSIAMNEAQPAFEHCRSWQGALMRVLTTGGAALAHDANDGSWQAARGGVEDVGAAHNPT